MPDIISSIRNEFSRYKSLAEGALAQVPDTELSRQASDNSNSIAAICWHLSGNLRSRFTDFLVTDGEKPWRHREEEFEARSVTRDQLLDKWSSGWDVLLTTLDSLTEADLAREVTVRQQPLRVLEALHRALAHVSYHVGQIVFLAKMSRGESWVYLSIPPGQSDRYNAAPTQERPETHASTIQSRMPGGAPGMGKPFKPEGYTSVAPYLIVNGAASTIDFLTGVFDATEIRRFAGANGAIMHAEVRVADTVVMIADGAPNWPAVPAHVHVYVPDVDASYRRAMDAGAVSVQEPVKKEDADKRGGVKDAGGTTWWIATKIE